jgi:erythromycin esterase-like protein
MSTAIDDWIAQDSIPFSPDSPGSLNAAVDRMVSLLDPAVQVLGLGEPMHGVEDFLLLRNRIFQRLAQAHGYTAIAIESSFPRGHLANDYVLGRAGESFDEISETGFSHGFGKSPANRELIEWMRRHNANVADDDLKLNFYGCDAPTEMTGADSPRQLLHVALDYLQDADRRQRIDDLLGNETDWTNPNATFDASKSIGRTPAAAALRVETEDLLAELSLRRPELVAKTGPARFDEAMHHATHARQLLTYHAELANPAPDRVSRCLGVRDVMMADNLAYIAAREGGKVFAFAHNYHLKRTAARWQWGADVMEWWPAGAHLDAMLGRRYAVIGTAVGALPAAGLGVPEPGTLESHLSGAPGPMRLIPTHRGRPRQTGDFAAALRDLPPRPPSPTNPGYFPLTPAQCVEDFDWVVGVG